MQRATHTLQMWQIGCSPPFIIHAPAFTSATIFYCYFGALQLPAKVEKCLPTQNSKQLNHFDANLD